MPLAAPESHPAHSGSKLRKALLQVALAWVALLLGMALYWVLLHQSQLGQLANAEAQTRLRAAQAAHALALQTGTQFHKLDYLARHLGEHWLEPDSHGFAHAIAVARTALPDGALVQVAIADRDGQIVYSSLATEPPANGAPMRISIADREHFRAHLDGAPPRLFISHPVFGRISQQWTVQFSRPLRDSGEFCGVILLSMSAHYLSAALRDIFPDSGDVALVVRDDGAYLARSQRLDQVLGSAVPPSRPFVVDPAARSGFYEARASIDETERHYAWHRVADYPVVVSLGLDRERALGPVRSALQDGRRQSLIGSALLLLAASVITWLWLVQVRQAAVLSTTSERLDLALRGGNLGTWDWDCVTNACRFNQRWADMLAYRDAPPPNLETWVRHVHPDDFPRVRALLQAHIDGAVDQYEAEYRMQRCDGSQIWVLDRGRAMQRRPDGSVLRMVGTLLDISARVAETQLRRALLDQSAAAIAVVSRDRKVLEVNQRAREIFLRPGEDAAALDMRRLHLSDAHYGAMLQHYRSLYANGSVRFEYPLVDVHGSQRWFDLHAVLRDPDSPASEIVWTLVDISEKHHAEAALATERLRLTALIERFPGGVLMEDASGVVAMANQRLCELLDLPDTPETLVGLDHRAFSARLGGDSRSTWLQLSADGKGAEKRRSVEIRHSNGRELEIDWVPIERQGTALGHVWLLRDITERKQHEAHLASLAATDALTGLPNRRSFMAGLDAVIADNHHHPERSSALLMLDIDHFKRVNDTYGHAIGDFVLQHVAQVIRHELRHHDSAGRLGGEEFAILLRGVDADGALALAERLRTTLAQTPAISNAGTIRVTVSIGLAMLDGDNAARLLRHADEALYEAKGQGRNRVCVWPL